MFILDAVLDAVRRCGVDYSAILTGGLLVAAFVAWRTDRAHTKGVREDAIRDVARRVHAWPAKKPAYIQDHDGTGKATLRVVLFNGSDEAVHDVNVEVAGAGFTIPSPAITKRTLPPGPEDRTVREVQIRTTTPQARVRSGDPEPSWYLDADDFDVQITFRDGTNRKWARESDGTLRAVT